MDNLVLVSGGFDPIHSGHIKLIREASQYGKVVVLLNSDKWLQNKKGKEFLPFYEREIIMKELKNVIDVLGFDDSDKTCIDGLRIARKKYIKENIMFANGGDRNDKTTPESVFCEENNIIFKIFFSCLFQSINTSLIRVIKTYNINYIF